MTLSSSTADREEREALRRLRSPEPLVLGQFVYLLTAERCEGCESSQEPIVDPHTFKWWPGVVVEPESLHDGLLCARVRHDDNAVGLYERRYIITETEAALLALPLVRSMP